MRGSRHRTRRCDVPEAKNGGAAPTISRQEPPDLVSSVVTVSDGHTELEEESEAAGRGYKAASAQLLDAALEDCRGYRCAAKLASTRIPHDDGTIAPDCIYNVNVAHDCGRIFFSAYDPSTSTRLVTSIHERDVDRLLAPNSIEHREHTAKSCNFIGFDIFLFFLMRIELGASK